MARIAFRLRHRVISLLAVALAMIGAGCSEPAPPGADAATDSGTTEDAAGGDTGMPPGDSGSPGDTGGPRDSAVDAPDSDGGAPTALDFVVGHRGGLAEAPESTLFAFERALGLGASIEMDVQFSSDDRIVVIHDGTVDRTTNGSGSVRLMTLAELQSLDAGSGERIPTFDEVAALFLRVAGPSAFMVIDTKVENARMYDALLAILVRDGILDRVFVEVTDSTVGDALRMREPAIQLAVWAPTEADVDQALMYAYYDRIHSRSGTRAAEIHARDMQLMLGVPDTASALEAALAWGIDGVITNKPAFILGLLAAP